MLLARIFIEFMAGSRKSCSRSVPSSQPAHVSICSTLHIDIFQYWLMQHRITKCRYKNVWNYQEKSWKNMMQLLESVNHTISSVVKIFYYNIKQFLLMHVESLCTRCYWFVFCVRCFNWIVVFLKKDKEQF